MESTESGALAPRDAHIVVVGGGMAGLVAALTCARVGLRITVLEASPRLGGAVRAAEVAGIPLDVGAEGYATRGGHVRALVDELGLGEDVVAPAAEPTWIAGLPGGAAAPLPAGGVLGIPENPFADDVRRILGWRGAWRAYLDRLRPPLTVGHEHSLGALVRSRMGDAVLDRLVAPVTTGIYSARPEDIDVDVAAPGLNAALTRAGSLSGAVGVVKAAATAGGAFEGIDGGMSRLVDALHARLVALGADVRMATPVRSLERTAERDEASTTWTVVTDAGELAADHVIVATGEEDARRLLSPHIPALAASLSRGTRVEVVTLVLDAPALDAHPRGTGVLTVPGSFRAKALTHATAKWEWLARATAGRHVVRVSLGGVDGPPASADLGDADAAALALAEASALLGVPLATECLVGAHRERYIQALPASARDQAATAAAARAAIRPVDGLAAVGAWLSGTGLAQVVPDAAAEADRVRRTALWGQADR